MSFDDRQKDLADMLKQVAADLEKSAGLSGLAKQRAVKECETVLGEAKAEFKALKTLASAHSQADKAKGTVKQLENEHARLDAMVKAEQRSILASQSNARNQLMSGGTADEYELNIDGDESQGFLRQMEDSKKRTNEAFSAINADLDDSRRRGVNTLEELGRQRSTINAIHDQTGSLRESLGKAGATVKNLAKRIATDRMFQGFIVVGLVLVILIVVWLKWG